MINKSKKKLVLSRVIAVLFKIVDDIKYVKEIYNAEAVWNGLGILPYSIAPHYKSDHPESDLIDKLVEYFIKEKIPYKTLSDGDAIIIT